jgi:hypothetical protein
MSGNTDFWHNDPFTGIGHPCTGNILFGADRVEGGAQLGESVRVVGVEEGVIVHVKDQG